MRKLSELYSIIIYKMKNHIGSLYICNSIEDSKHPYGFLKMTEQEIKGLLKDFTLNKPTPLLHTDFFNNKYYSKNSEEYDAWWGMMEYTSELRAEKLKEKIRFLEHLKNMHISNGN